MTAPRWFDDETTALMGERARVRRLERRPATAGGATDVGDYAIFGRSTSHTVAATTSEHVPIDGFATSSRDVFGTGDGSTQNDTSGDTLLYCIRGGAYYLMARITTTGAIPAGVKVILDALGGYGYQKEEAAQVIYTGPTYAYSMSMSVLVPADAFFPEKIGVLIDNTTGASFTVDTVGVNAVWTPASADLASVY